MVRRVTIFGATGSIGCNTVDLIAADREAFERAGWSTLPYPVDPEALVRKLQSALPIEET